MLYYNIVRGANEIDLEARVNSLTGFDDSKWAPIGGPIVDKYGSWFQALIAPKDVKVKIDNGPLTGQGTPLPRGASWDSDNVSHRDLQKAGLCI